MFLQSIPNDLRILLVLVTLLSVAAFLLGGFALYLFYRFYRDAVRPFPRLTLQVSETNIALRLVNLGNNPLVIKQFVVEREGRRAGSVASFLPLINDGTGYISYAPVVEGKKLNPDQEIRLFEFNLALQGSDITLNDIRNIIDHLSGLTFELLCHDLGERYHTPVRQKIVIDPMNWKLPNAS
jgi:hypothetical protein